MSTIVREFIRQWGEAPNSPRSILAQCRTRAPLASADSALEEQRAWLVADWIAHQYSPAWLSLAGLSEEANALRALLTMTAESEEASRATIQRAAEATGEAWEALRGTSWALTMEPVRDTVEDAIHEAERDVACNAGGSAIHAAGMHHAWNVVWDLTYEVVRDAIKVAAWTAVRDIGNDASLAIRAVVTILAPTVRTLQASAGELLDRLILLGREDTLSVAVLEAPAGEERENAWAVLLDYEREQGRMTWATYAQAATSSTPPCPRTGEGEACL